mmetsp:Transcript_23488/g.11294  ORF Transcript_23488/g.11294 Transcript_23488/m.11294 type:complete len:83 (+) Transcript_23488:45-293(+)
MTNWFMNFGLFFETALAAVFCYTPPFNIAFGTRDLTFEHFGIPALPYFIIIFVYDELRKYCMRRYREKHYNEIGWLERNTYY